MNETIASIKAYGSLIRPKFQLPSIISMLVGLLYSLYSGSKYIPDFKLIAAAILVTGPFVAGGALVLNQVCDCAYDRASMKRNLPLASGKIKKENGACLSLILLSLGELASLVIGAQAAAATVMAVGFSIFYSVPPMRFKARPALDSISNGLCYGVFPTLVGWTVAARLSFEAVYICMPLFLLFTGSHILLAIPDIRDDKESGMITSAVVLGQTNAIRTAGFLWLLTATLLATFITTRLFPLQSLAVLPVLALGLVELIRSNPVQLDKTFSRLKFVSSLMGLIFALGFLSALV
jgi:geranylgeranylglycerol-phosphate geranylgeranyltransferase